VCFEEKLLLVFGLVFNMLHTQSIFPCLVLISFAGISFQSKLEWNNGGINLLGGPPPPSEAARMARYIVHNSDWASIATISSMKNIKSFPFANTYSVSDGTVANSSGIPYLYMTPLEMSSQDLAVS
jgi:hypothetical protein